MSELYNYIGKVISVYDGDTVKVDIDLGFSLTFTRVTLRLSRINAPEMRGVERSKGIISRDFLRSQILGKTIKIKTIRDKKGKYGRYIAELFYQDGTSINDDLVTRGLAVYKKY